MAETKPKYSTGKYWVIFFLSIIAFASFLMFMPGFFWVTLPFLLTSFVAATRLI